MNRSGPLTVHANIFTGDEVRDAPKKVPWTMVLAVAVDGILALAMIITILFSLGPLQGALDAPTNGYPIIQVLYLATKSKAGATALMSLTIFCGLVSLFNGLASTTRLAWAFAKDHGLPFSGFFSYVSYPSIPWKLADNCRLTQLFVFPPTHSDLSVSS